MIETIKEVGEVERVKFYKEDSGWACFNFKTEDQRSFTVVGVFPEIVEAQALEIEGCYMEHPKFGKQFKATSYCIRIPTSEKGMQKYLEWTMPEIGMVRAREIVKRFGKETFRVIDEEPKQLLEIDGINEERLKDIILAWKEKQLLRKAFVYLARFGLTKAMVEKTIERFGEFTIEVVEKDPYVLTEVAGLSFYKVDAVALNMGIPPNSPQRRRAAITFLLRENTRGGHVFMTLEDLRHAVMNLKLPQMNRDAWSENEIANHVRELVEQKFAVKCGDNVYLKELYLYEVSAALKLKEMAAAPVGRADVNRILATSALDQAAVSAVRQAHQRISAQAKEQREGLTEKQRLDAMLNEDPESWFDDGEEEKLDTDNPKTEDEWDAMFASLEETKPVTKKAEEDDFDAILAELSAAPKLKADPFLEAALADFPEETPEVEKRAEGRQEFQEAPEGHLFHPDVIEQFLSEYQEAHGIEFSEEQRNSMYLVNRSRTLLVTGLPGTGKTTVLKAVLALYQRAGLGVQLCAPTGKAAKRLEQVTGRPAATIHRYLKGYGDTWTHNAAYPAPDQVVIVDEFSMVDTHLMFRLIDALPPDHYLVMVGDPGQLPSVGAGSVLKDLIDSKVVPRVHLQEIFRQSAESAIIVNAHNIHNGQSLEINRGQDFFVGLREGTADSLKLLRMVCERLLEKGEDFQVISPKKKGQVGTIALNQLLKPILNPGIRYKEKVTWSKRDFHMNDKVIMTRNDYDKKVFNGDIGEVVRLDPKKRKLFIKFEDSGMREEWETGPQLVPFQGDDINMLDLAYALTVHKSQGSEWRNVVLLMVNEHGRMLRRRLFYTAVTRAKKQIFVIGEGEAMETAVRVNTDDRRNTTLNVFLQESEAVLDGRIEDFHAGDEPQGFTVASEA